MELKPVGSGDLFGFFSAARLKGGIRDKEDDSDNDYERNSNSSGCGLQFRLLCLLFGGSRNREDQVK